MSAGGSRDLYAASRDELDALVVATYAHAADCVGSLRMRLFGLSRRIQEAAHDLDALSLSGEDARLAAQAINWFCREDVAVRAEFAYASPLRGELDALLARVAAAR